MGARSTAASAAIAFDEHAGRPSGRVGAKPSRTTKSRDGSSPSLESSHCSNCKLTQGEPTRFACTWLPWDIQWWGIRFTGRCANCERKQEAQSLYREIFCML